MRARDLAEHVGSALLHVLGGPHREQALALPHADRNRQRLALVAAVGDVDVALGPVEILARGVEHGVAAHPLAGEGLRQRPQWQVGAEVEAAEVLGVAQQRGVLGRDLAGGRGASR